MVSLVLAKQQIHVLHEYEDGLIDFYLSAATKRVENFTGKKITRGLVSQRVESFTDAIKLHYGPEPMTATVTYTDVLGNQQSIMDAKISGGLLWPLLSWPDAAEKTDVIITYTAGYELPPADLEHAVLLLVGEYYNNRESGSARAEISGAVEALCRPYRDVLV